MVDNPSFENDQYFYLKKERYSSALKQIEEIIDNDARLSQPYEKVWIPENQVTGTIKKIGAESFSSIEVVFNQEIAGSLEEKTGLQNLELVAVRKNVLTGGELVTAHSDTLGYVAMLEIPSDSSEFEGGNIVFTKDDGDVVELPVSRDQILVVKCTNEHGVTRLTKGKRESIAFFARPKE